MIAHDPNFFSAAKNNTTSNSLEKLRSMEEHKEDEIELLHETKAVVNKNRRANTKSKFFANKRRRTLENTNDSVDKEEENKGDPKRKSKKPKQFWKIHDLK